jgi:hypothetical protein
MFEAKADNEKFIKQLSESGWVCVGGDDFKTKLVYTNI